MTIRSFSFEERSRDRVASKTWNGRVNKLDRAAIGLGLFVLILGSVSGCRSNPYSNVGAGSMNRQPVEISATQRQQRSDIALTNFASQSGGSVQDDETQGRVAFPESINSGSDTVALPQADTGQNATNVRSVNAGNFISLEQVLATVANCYPEIDAAIGEIERANGEVLAAWGKFDQTFTAHSISQPLGFYQTYRNGVGLNQPLFGGGEVYGTYRIGDGNFEPWFGERETNEAGEFKAGFSLPLAKDRAIDKRRANLFAAGLERDQVEYDIESRLLLLQRAASQVYWDWVAAGQAVQIQKRLLELAETRVEQIKTRIEKGDLAEIARIDNERFIAKRTNSLIKARRTLEKAAIKMSLFWRDSNCQPVIAAEEQLPPLFPNSQLIADAQIQSDVATALSVRPELAQLQAAREAVCVDMRYAENLTLPKLDLKGFIGQDIGGETSSTGDKTPFEMQLGVLAEVPIQRREGFGKIQAAQGKLTQVDAKIRFVSDKIRAEVQDAASAVNAAHRQVLQSTENLQLTQQSLVLGRIAFDEGDIDLIALNIYETAVADAELQLLDAQFKFFFYRAVYETATRATAFSN